MSRFRVAVAGFMHESNTFSPLYADRSSFEQQGLCLGADIRSEWSDAHHEMGGFLEQLDRLGHEVVPIVMAWATPSGPVRDAVFDEITKTIVRGVGESSPDGLLLALHGAMVTESHPDADADTVAILRERFGRELPIVVTLDFHANVSPRLIGAVDAVVAYQTNPHVDQRECGQRAATLLDGILNERIRPTVSLEKPPLIFNIMAQDTGREPLQSLMARARDAENRPEVLTAQILGGFAYADVPQMGPAVIVSTNDAPDLAAELAHDLADQILAQRERLAPTLPDASEAVHRALAVPQEKTPVVLVDTGDNVGGGSAGDGTVLLAELLRQGATRSVVCLYAPQEVRRCQTVGIGGSVRFEVGGKVDRLHGDPVRIEGIVRNLHDGRYIEPETRHGGKRENNMGPTAVVEMAGENLLVLNSLRHPPFSLGQLTCVGIDPRQQRILVVKAAVAYKAAYGPIAGTIIEVDTPGLTAVNPHRFEYRHIRRPMYPLDAI